jgi:hypothetical protein
MELGNPTGNQVTFWAALKSEYSRYCVGNGAGVAESANTSFASVAERIGEDVSVASDAGSTLLAIPVITMAPLGGTLVGCGLACMSVPHPANPNSRTTLIIQSLLLICIYSSRICRPVLCLHCAAPVPATLAQAGTRETFVVRVFVDGGNF